MEDYLLIVKELFPEASDIKEIEGTFSSLLIRLYEKEKNIDYHIPAKVFKVKNLEESMVVRIIPLAFEFWVDEIIEILKKLDLERLKITIPDKKVFSGRLLILKENYIDLKPSIQEDPKLFLELVKQLQNLKLKERFSFDNLKNRALKVFEEIINLPQGEVNSLIRDYLVEVIGEIKNLSQINFSHVQATHGDLTQSNVQEGNYIIDFFMLKERPLVAEIHAYLLDRYGLSDQYSKKLIWILGELRLSGELTLNEYWKQVYCLEIVKSIMFECAYFVGDNKLKNDLESYLINKISMINKIRDKIPS